MGLPQLSTTAAASTSRWIVPAVLGLAAVALAAGSYYVVPQTEVAYIKLATGIGCGLVLNGRAYRGTSGTATTTAPPPPGYFGLRAT